MFWVLNEKNRSCRSCKFFSMTDQRLDIAIQDLFVKKNSILAIQDLIAISETFFTELPIELFRLFVFNNKYLISCWCVLRV